MRTIYTTPRGVTPWAVSRFAGEDELMVEVMTALWSADPDFDARLLLAVISGLEVDGIADEPASA